jgi:hypothetical protein
MRKAVEYLRSHPIIAIAIAVLIVGVVAILVTTPRPARVGERPLLPAPVPGTTPGPQGTPGSQGTPGAPTSPGAVTTPAPRATPTPRPSPTARTVAVPVDAGRPDPFVPLVRSESGAAAGPSGVPVPPPAPLPPPLFPGQPQPGQPGQPQPPAPTPAPKESSSAELVGIIGDSGGTAIIRLGGKTYIVNQGDLINSKIRVAVVDATKGLVILEEEGERFELKLGGVSGGHVAASASSGLN